MAEPIKMQLGMLSWMDPRNMYYMGWCPDGDFLSHFCVLHFQQAACSTLQTCILNLHYGHTMCRSMVNIHSGTAEIRRGKKRKKKETGQKYNVRICYTGRP